MYFIQHKRTDKNYAFLIASLVTNNTQDRQTDKNYALRYGQQATQIKRIFIRQNWHKGFNISWAHSQVRGKVHNSMSQYHIVLNQSAIFPPIFSPKKEVCSCLFCLWRFCFRLFPSDLFSTPTHLALFPPEKKKGK